MPRHTNNVDSVVKCGLKQIIRGDADELIDVITNAVKVTTRVERLASLYAHWDITKTVLENEFNCGIIKDMFKVDFNAAKYYESMQISAKKCKHEIHRDFLALLEKNNVQIPNVAGIGQCIKYAFQAYARVFQTNINTHMYSRIRKYFKSLIDYKKKENRQIVYSTLHFLFNAASDKIPLNDLLISYKKDAKPVFNVPDNIPYALPCGFFADKKKW